MKPTLGQFVISIDYEYAVGYADIGLNEAEKKLVLEEPAVAKRILELFEKYDFPATWAIVGHLLETDCQVKEGRVHANFPAKIYTDNDLDWFKDHPPAGDYDDPLWFDSAGIIKLISRSKVQHEIASHSYAHILYGAPNIKEEAVAADVSDAARIHQENKLPFVSFIFPRNSEGHHEKLQRAGILCFRGESKFWYMSLPGPLRRLARLLDYYLPFVKTVQPNRHESGLINIPDSLLLLGRNGLRKLVLPGVMKAKIRRGLKQAAKRKEIFHLWFHPSNFSYDTDTQLEILEDALRYAKRLRDQGELAASTMKNIVETN